MNIAEFLKQNRAIVSAITKNHIFPEDLALIEMYEEATDMLSRGEKTSFVAAYMSDKYGFSERHYYRVMGRLSQAIN